MGRALGKLTGKATGFIYKARAQLFDFAEKTELTKVQQELQMTMQQLQAIRSELQGGINILDPGPLSRQILGGGGGGGRNAVLGGLDNISSSGGSKKNTMSSVTLDNQTQQQQNSGLPFAASGGAATAAAAGGSKSSSLGSFQAAQSVSPLHHQQQHSFEVLPISAAAAGLIPDRSHTRQAASEILADALQEEKVAHQALMFFKQGQQLVDTTKNSSGESGTGTAVKKSRKPRKKKGE
jgi:hypothetical protein